MTVITRIISICLIVFISGTVLQSAFSGLDGNCFKKIELSKKNCEDSSEEEQEASDDVGEDDYEETCTTTVHYFYKQKLSRRLKPTQVLHYLSVNYSSITTPPPEFES